MHFTRHIAAIAAVAITCAAVVASPASAATGSTTHLTLEVKGANAFSGKVTSTSDSCVAGRKVILFRKRSGHDKNLGSDKTSSSGAWKVKRTVKSGNYYAKVTKVTVGNVICASAKTNTLHI